MFFLFGRLWLARFCRPELSFQEGFLIRHSFLKGAAVVAAPGSPQTLSKEEMVDNH